MEFERSGFWAEGGGATLRWCGQPRWSPSVAEGAADRVGSSHIKSKQPGRTWQQSMVAAVISLKMIPSFHPEM